MFPLAHWYFGKQLAGGRYDPLFLLGGTLPDLGRSMGLDRNQAHSRDCRIFYEYASTQAQELIPAALGMLGHGIDPYGVDYYADEHWCSGDRGWCFQQGKRYIPQVVKACALPPDWGFWKSHNFVEMACDLACQERHPELSQEIVQAVSDEEARQVLTSGLSKCFGLDPARVSHSLAMLPQIYSIEDPTPLTLGERYKEMLSRVHQLDHANAGEAADLIGQIKKEKTDAFWIWAKEVSPLVIANLTTYQKNPTKD